MLVAGPLVAWIVGALEGAVVTDGLAAIGAGLFSIGIPKDSVVKCESAIKADKLILLAHGTAAEVAKAKDIIQNAHPTELALHGSESQASATLARRNRKVTLLRIAHCTFGPDPTERVTTST